MDGGSGFDTADFTYAVSSALSNPIFIDLAAGIATGVDLGTDTLVNIESVVTDWGDDEVWGNAQINYFNLNYGNDVAHGGGGNDWFDGSSGNDTLYGDDGNDELYGGNDDDTLYGGNDNDQLFGSSGNDTLYGDSGSDELYGHDGDDVLQGGIGQDELDGSLGDDVLDGDGGIDTAIFIPIYYPGDAVTVDLASGTATSVEFGNDQLVEIENVTTGDGDDWVQGNNLANVIVTGGERRRRPWSRRDRHAPRRRWRRHALRRRGQRHAPGA